jgi:hypothetical protein
VYVVEEEMEKYRAAIAPEIEVRKGAIGCIGNRSAILDDYPEGTHLVFMDDDIKDIITTCDFTEDHESCKCYLASNLRTPGYLKHRSIGTSLSLFFDRAFDTMIDEGVHFSGINAVANGYFNKHAYRVGLNAICGAFFMEIIRKDLPQPTCEYAEDFNRSLIHFKRDGKTIKFLFVGLKTDYYTGNGDSGKGGMCDSRTFDLVKSSIDKCLSEFPGLARAVPPDPPRRPYWNIKCKRLPSNINKEWV